jgi:hypothetical protein
MKTDTLNTQDEALNGGAVRDCPDSAGYALAAKWRDQAQGFKASAIEQKKLGNEDEARVRAGWAGCYFECATELEMLLSHNDQEEARRK